MNRTGCDLQGVITVVLTIQGDAQPAGIVHLSALVEQSPLLSNSGASIANVNHADPIVRAAL